MRECHFCHQRVVNPEAHYDARCVPPVPDSESVASRKIETQEDVWEAN